MREEIRMEMSKLSRRVYGVIRIIKGNKPYAGAVVSGYLLMVMTIAVQVVLIRIYLEKLGNNEFGILILILSLINYAGIGVGWMTGGVLRVMGEYTAFEDENGFARAYSLAKMIYVSYA